MRKHIFVLLLVGVLSATPSACSPAQTSVPTLTPTATKEPIPTVSVPEDSDFHVNPIEGLSPDFIMGADVSMLKQIEDNGGKFHIDGKEADALEILKAHGVNWIRLRIWNDPTDENGESLGGGNNDLETTVAIAARAKAMGFKFLLDFHYSDWWADPGKQNMPKAWEGLDAEALNQALYDYTAEVIKTLADEGAMPDMVQIGNEVNSGMMWPARKTWSEGAEVVGGYDGFADLLKQGVQAVRDNDPNNEDPEKRVRIIIHLADGGNNSLYRTMFDELTGTIEGSDLQATASITTGGDKNYLVNAGFESGDFNPWVVNGDTGAVDISNERQNLHEGKYAMHYWADDPFEFTVSQTVTDVENGTYIASAWIQGGGTEDLVQFFADCGGETQVVDLETNGWLNWKTPTIENINVTDGTCTIGLTVVASGGQWAFLDETSLYLVE